MSELRNARALPASPPGWDGCARRLSMGFAWFTTRLGAGRRDRTVARRELPAPNAAGVSARRVPPRQRRAGGGGRDPLPVPRRHAQRLSRVGRPGRPGRGRSMVGARPSATAAGGASPHRANSARIRCCSSSAVAVALSLVYALVVGLTTPPDTYDALAHQLVRAAAWRQQHSVAPIANVNDNLGVNASPPNAELQMLFTLVLVGRDTFAIDPAVPRRVRAARLGLRNGKAGRFRARRGGIRSASHRHARGDRATSGDDRRTISSQVPQSRSQRRSFCSDEAVRTRSSQGWQWVSRSARSSPSSFALPAFVLIAIAVGGYVRRIAVIVADVARSASCASDRSSTYSTRATPQR